jgi:hypothetical protein
MTRRPLKKLERKPVLRGEDLEAAVRKLQTDMAEAASLLAKETAVADGSNTEALGKFSDLSGQAEAAIRGFLEEETLAVLEPEGPRGIAEHELHREVIKKALVGLKSSVLREVARTRGVQPAGKLDDLAQQVAASYGWDEAEIARLVLDYAEDPRATDGGPTTRLFVFEAPVDLARADNRLSYVDGRYYRTDIAKWFTFERHRRADSTITIIGNLLTYRAQVDAVEEGKLSAAHEMSQASLDIREGGRVGRVHGAKNQSVARSMMAAFKVATGMNFLDYVPNSGFGDGLKAHSLHPSTVFLLDLVTYGLRGHMFRQRNPILARFRFSRAEASYLEEGASQAAVRKPSLKAVRFEGANLLDSTTACGLMWTEGRPLVDLTVEVAVTDADAGNMVVSRVPIRIALEKDHVLVATGLSSDAGITSDVHRRVVEQVELAITEGVSHEHRSRLEQVVRNRAENPDPNADAELLEDEVEMI